MRVSLALLGSLCLMDPQAEQKYIEILFFYSKSHTYTVPEVGTLLQRRLHCFYRDRIFDQRPRDRQTWSTHRQHGILTCSLRACLEPLHPGMKKAYKRRLLTQHAVPNGTHGLASDGGKRCSAHARHGGRCRVAFEMEKGNER